MIEADDKILFLIADFQRMQGLPLPTHTHTLKITFLI